MAKPRIQIYADLPRELHDADATLQRYGAWCVSGQAVGGRCGSAEGLYRAPGGDALEARRQPLDMMTGDQALRVQRALLGVDELHRGVLVMLYVPRRLPPEAQLRLMRIPPRLSQVRHLEGLRRWWPAYRMLEKQATASLLPHGERISLYF